MNRGTGLAVVAGVVALGLIAWFVVAARTRGAADAFEASCEALIVGDPLVVVYGRMGLEGYRPGCGSRLPCESLEVGDQRWALSCTPEDCSQLWKLDAVACMVEFEPTTRRLISAELVRMPR